MMRKAFFTSIVTVLVIGATPAHAGPCTTDIARFEAEVLAARTGPDAGPSGPQSVGAQMEHQPTPKSVARARQQALARFDSVLARAKTLDSQNDPACKDALAEARLIYFQ
jgi:creatinine amidohydrolase/Fe(II)-dependent formamide hydrolase-like protein